MTSDATTDREQFRRDGYFVVERLFSPDECEEIVAHIEAAPLTVPLGDPSDGQMLYRPMLHLADPHLQAVCCDSRFADVVLPILGPDVRLYWEQSVAKPPEARTELPWHQDNGYTPVDPPEYLTCWLALDDADVANGCIWVIPGSHRAGTVRHHDGPGPFRVGRDDPAGGVPVPVRRGDVLVFSSLLMHRSGPNVSGRDRRAWIIQFCVAHARSLLSGRALDDRLLVAEAGCWLAQPRRERPFDLAAVLANYQRDDDASVAGS
ncbi:MAG: hypothetical protein C4344_03675 [Acidimicrobiia bacterium]